MTTSRQTQQLMALMGGAGISKNSVWLGGLLFPTAYLTATQQTVAEALRWSLDDLRLELQIGPPKPVGVA